MYMCLRKKKVRCMSTWFKHIFVLVFVSGTLVSSERKTEIGQSQGIWADIVTHRAPGQRVRREVEGKQCEVHVADTRGLSSTSLRIAKLMKHAPLAAAVLGLGVETFISHKGSVSSAASTLHPFSNRLVRKMGRSSWLLDVGAGYALNSAICWAGRIASSYTLRKVIDPDRPRDWGRDQWDILLSQRENMGQAADQHALLALARCRLLPVAQMAMQLYHRNGFKAALKSGLTAHSYGELAVWGRNYIINHLANFKNLHAFYKECRAEHAAAQANGQRSLFVTDFMKRTAHAMFGNCLYAGISVAAVCGCFFEGLQEDVIYTPADDAELEKWRSILVGSEDHPIADWAQAHSQYLQNYIRVQQYLQNYIRVHQQNKRATISEFIHGIMPFQALKALVHSGYGGCVRRICAAEGVGNRLDKIDKSPYYTWTAACDVLQLPQTLREALKSGNRTYHVGEDAVAHDAVTDYTNHVDQLTPLSEELPNLGEAEGNDDRSCAQRMMHAYVERRFGVKLAAAGV